MYILLFFIIFASALNYTYIPKSFNYLKDIIIFYFFGVLISQKKIKMPKNIGYSFYIMFVIVLIISWLGIVNNGTDIINIIIRIIRYIEFFILFFIFTNINKITTKPYDRYIDCFIKLSIVLVAVHIIGYFIPNPIVSIYIDNKIGNGFYRNRISIGQPAIAVYPMIVSILFLLVYKKNDYRTVLKIIVLTLGVIISISITGILSLIMIFLIFMVLNSKKESRKKLWKIFISITIILFLALRVIVLNPTIKKIYDKQKSLMYIKIVALFNEDLNDLSMNARDIKYYQAKQSVKNRVEKIIGVGILGYDNEEKHIGSLENTYRTFRICYGLVGEICIICFIFKQITYGIKYHKYKEGMIILLLFFNFAMHCYTLEVLYLPTISYSLPLFYCYIKNKNEILQN